MCSGVTEKITGEQWGKCTTYCPKIDIVLTYQFICTIEIPRGQTFLHKTY